MSQRRGHRAAGPAVSCLGPPTVLNSCRTLVCLWLEPLDSLWSSRAPIQLPPQGDLRAWQVRLEVDASPYLPAATLGRAGLSPALPLLRLRGSSLLLAFLEEACVCASVWLPFHLTTLLSNTPAPLVSLFVEGLGLVGERGQARHSSPVSEAPGLQARSLQCLCCVFFPPWAGGARKVWVWVIFV